jgi:small subunit ribosomal protein S15
MLPVKKKAAIIKKVQAHDKDTGSASVQIAILTERINALSLHLKKNNKDNHSRRGLLQMVADRRKHLQYLEKTDKTAYEKIAKTVKLK